MSLSDDIKLLVEVRQPKHHEEGWDSLVSVGVSFRYEYSLKSEVHKNLSVTLALREKILVLSLNVSEQLIGSATMERKRKQS